MIQIPVLINHSENGIAKGTKMLTDKLTQAVAEAYKKMKQEELKGDQHKIDANKNGQIDAHDFKILRGQKNEETELEPGQGSHLNLGGARVKNTRSDVLAHVKKTFPNAKDIKKTQYGWGPKNNSVDEAMEETEPKSEKEKDLAALGHPKDKITHKDVLIGRGVIKKEEWDSKKPTVSEAEELNEDLRNWFKPDHPEGGWKRINSKGEAIGPCAREPGEPKPKCMSNEKRASLTKKERAAAVSAKRRHDPNPERKGAPINVSNFGKGKISESVEYIEEKNAPTNPELWSRAKALAKQKFDVYPSAYANGWASKWYKSKGGGWKTVSEELELQEGKMAQLHADIEDAVGQHVKDYNAGKLGHDSFGEKVVAAHQKISKLHGIKPEHAKKFVNDYVDQNMKEEVELDEMNNQIHHPGTKVKVPHRGKMVSGKVVRHDKGDKYGSPFYVVDVGEYESAKVPAHNVTKEEFELTEGNDDVGEMIKDKLKIIINRAKEMHDGIGPNTDMPEWVKSKITLAQDYVSTACDYSCGSEQLGEDVNEGLLGSIAKGVAINVLGKMAANALTKKDDKKEKEQVDERCWDGYKAVQGKEAYSKGSCTKEETELTEAQIGDMVHIGHSQKGGTGYRGKLIKIDGENAHVELPAEPGSKWGNRVVKGKVKNLTKEEVEIQEDMGEPDIKVRSTYTKAYADHYKRALRMTPKGASKRAQIMAYDTVKAKHGEEATNALRAFHDKNQNEGYQLDEELSSRAKLVKELFNKAKEKKSKKDVFEADPEMEIMPSPQYSQQKNK